MKVALFVFWLGFLSSPLMAVTYYVSGNGADTNDGLKPETPFRTIQKAADLTLPGDTVLVMNGTYTNAWWSGAVVHLTRSGTDSAWITFKAGPGQHPVVSFNGWAGFSTETASYIEINGFTITGNNDNITLDYALWQKDWPDPRCNGNGISIDGRNQGAKEAHHYRLLNNVISKCGGGGIGICTSDFITIEGNRVFDNSWYTRYGTSGISVCVMSDSDASTGTKIIIRGNISYNNRTLVPWSTTGKPTDGNGIIIDSGRDTHYAGRTLVADNLCVNNGGSGIHAFHSDHVDIVNNTTWHNSQKLDYGEIYSNASDDVTILNNICVAAPGKPMNSNYNNGRVVYDSNLFFGGLAPVVRGTHALIADPLLVNPKDDPARGDFRVQPKSPAILAGAVTPLTPATDLGGTARPAGKACDLGAYQSDIPQR